MKGDQVGAASVPPPKRVNSLQALTRLKAVNGSKWNVFAYVLNRDMVKEDGSLDELHAVVFCLGSFDEREKAEEHAKNIIEITGHPAVIAAGYSVPVPLTTNISSHAVTEVPVDMKGKLIQLESAQYKQEREEFEKRLKIEQEIAKESEEETNPDSLEYFKRQCYLLVKNNEEKSHHSNALKTCQDNIQNHESKIKQHLSKFPHHETQWLPYLKEKLAERGELSLYNRIEKGYSSIRQELLNSLDETPEPVSETEESETEEDILASEALEQPSLEQPLID